MVDTPQDFLKQRFNYFKSIDNEVSKSLYEKHIPLKLGKLEDKFSKKSTAVDGSDGCNSRTSRSKSKSRELRTNSREYNNSRQQLHSKDFRVFDQIYSTNNQVVDNRCAEYYSNLKDVTSKVNNKSRNNSQTPEKLRSDSKLKSSNSVTRTNTTRKTSEPTPLFTFKPEINRNSSTLVEKMIKENRKKPLMSTKSGDFEGKLRDKHNLKFSENLIRSKIDEISRNPNTQYFFNLQQNSMEEASKIKDTSQQSAHCQKLYSKGLDQLRKSKEKITKERKVKSDNEMLGVTFKPEISKKSREMTEQISRSRSKNNSIYSGFAEISNASSNFLICESKEFLANKKNKKEALIQCIRSKQEESCPFKPDMTKSKLVEDEKMIKRNLGDINRYVKSRRLSANSNNSNHSKSRSPQFKIEKNRSIIEHKEKDISQVIFKDFLKIIPDQPKISAFTETKLKQKEQKTDQIAVNRKVYNTESFFQLDPDKVIGEPEIPTTDKMIKNIDEENSNRYERVCYNNTDKLQEGSTPKKYKYNATKVRLSEAISNLKSAVRIFPS